MRRVLIVPSLLLLALCLIAAAQDQPQLGRSMHGVVLDAQNHPMPAAIVYLRNLRTKSIDTAIAADDGSYSFHQLDANTTYEVYAAWKGQRSPTRTDSQYEPASDLRLDLKIPVSN